MEQNVQKAEQMKYRLADAMKQCMAKMPIERITVRQIVELSGTTRQTFYRHFQDKYDLINRHERYEYRIGHSRFAGYGIHGFLRRR